MTYIEYVKWSLRFLMREGRWSVFLELRMDARNRVTNQDMEYWYMGSMEPRLEMQKNRMEEWTATGVYLTQHMQENTKDTGSAPKNDFQKVPKLQVDRCT